MSLPTSLEAIAIIILIFIPGYIFLQFTKSAVAFVPQAVDARYFFAVITWGGVVHLVASHWTLPINSWYQDGTLDEHQTYLLWWGLLTLVVGPVVIGGVGAWFIKLPWIDFLLKGIAMDYVSRTPSAWNYATKAGPAWLRVHLKDGTIIGGKYEEHSFADDSGEQDIYLEQVYNLTDTGDFGDSVPGNSGVWIPHDVISHVMFFNIKKEDSNGSENSDIDTPTET